MLRFRSLITLIILCSLSEMAHGTCILGFGSCEGERVRTPVEAYLSAHSGACLIEVPDTKSSNSMVRVLINGQSKLAQLDALQRVGLMKLDTKEYLNSLSKKEALKYIFSNKSIYGIQSSDYLRPFNATYALTPLARLRRFGRL